MEIDLPPNQRTSLENYVKSGRFTSIDEAIQKAIDLLEADVQERSELQEAVDEADADFANGRFHAYNEATLPHLVEELKSEARLLRNSSNQ